MDDSTSGGGPAPAHWDKVYAERTLSELSWFEPEPTMSLEVIESLRLDPAAPIVDVGGGASSLVDALLERGHLDLTVLDLSAVALRAARDRIGRRSSMVHWAATDLREWRPTRRYRLWHDRAVFHFLVDPADRKHYRDLLVRGVEPGGFVLLATFAPDGPPPLLRPSRRPLRRGRPRHRHRTGIHRSERSPRGSSDAGRCGPAVHLAVAASRSRSELNPHRFLRPTGQPSTIAAPLPARTMATATVRPRTVAADAGVRPDRTSRNTRR